MSAVDREKLAYQLWWRFADHEIDSEREARAEWPCFNAEKWRNEAAWLLDFLAEQSAA